MNYQQYRAHLSVKEIYTGWQYYQVNSLEGYILEISLQESKCWPLDIAKFDFHIPLKECLISGILCSDSYLKNQEGQWVVVGNPIEGALIVAASKAELYQSTLQQLMPKLDTIPFSSKFQYMATLHQNIGGNTIYFKGTSETILSHAQQMLDKNGNLIELDSELVALEAESMIEDGLQVLAFAKKQVSAEKTSLDRADLESGFIFLGLQGMN